MSGREERPRIGVVGIPGKWSTEALADALEERTGFRLVTDMGAVSADLEKGRLLAGGHDLTELDGIVVKKISETYSPHTLDRIELLRLAERAGVRVFSRPETIVRMIDRLACTMTLRNGGIPMPPTVVTENLDEAMDALKEYGEAVVKPMYSTKARGMILLNAEEETESIRARLAEFQEAQPMIYLQQRLALPGRDLGMVFLGGHYLGSYARVAQGEAWNTTIHSGGRYEGHEPPAEIVEMARQAQALFGMDFTTVDVAETERGPVVFEVSAFGGFRGAKEGIGIDAAALYADYVIDEVKQA